MPHPSRRPPLQLDLFEEVVPRPPGVPPLAALPQRTQTVLTELVTRMLVAHARGEAADREDADDHA
jgi:hypothetical protein